MLKKVVATGTGSAACLMEGRVVLIRGEKLHFRAHLNKFTNDLLALIDNLVGFTLIFAV